MGDKTQFLAMAFATKYNPLKVLIAIFFATVFSHSLAVIAGHLLSAVVPIDIIFFIAALSFIIFGLWTIRGENFEEKKEKESHFGPIVTVAIAFFLAEMGDKTQLATVSLAVEYNNMFYVLFGTTLGMILGDAVGIIVGLVMKKHIPQNLIKWIAAVIFILFGLNGIYKISTAKLSLIWAWNIIIIFVICIIFAAYYLSRKKQIM